MSLSHDANKADHVNLTGRVEIFDNGRWGAVCDKQFDNATKKDNFAKATCKSLGHFGGEWMPAQVKKGTVSQKKMECYPGEQLEDCDNKGQYIIWFRKASKLGAPKSSGGKQYSMWALKQNSPWNNLQKVLQDCALMPGCFSVGQKVKASTPSLYQKSVFNKNSVKQYAPSAANFARNINTLRHTSNQCTINAGADFANFSNRSQCSGGSRSWIGYKFVWIIEDTENKHWHFAPFANFGLGGVV